MKPSPLYRASLFADLRPLARSDAARLLWRFRHKGMICYVASRDRRYIAPVGHAMDMMCVRIPKGA